METIYLFWIVVSCLLAPALSYKRPCEEVFGKPINLQCICNQDSDNGTLIDCDRISFFGDFPVLPHRYKIHGYRQRHAGIQTLESLLFTASAVPLKTVDFSYNLLRRLTERVFDGVQDTLEEIYLSHNQLGDQLNPIFSTGELKQLKNLKVLDLSANMLRSIDSRVFDGLISLQILNLQQNDLNKVPGSSLDGLTSLRTLLLQENDFTEISRLSFPKLPSLNILNLTGNHIMAIQHGAFFNLTNLKILSIARNKLSVFSEDPFVGLTSLEILDFSNNFFQAVPFPFLAKIKSLKSLILHSNRIRSIDETSMSTMTQLEYLDLGRNRLFSLPPNVFSGLRKMKILIVDLNNIPNPNNNTFYGLESLSDLSMMHNSLLTFPSLLTFRNLRKLNLNYNRIKALPRNILTSVKYLEEFSITYNLVSEIPDGTFHGFLNLRILNLRGNNLSIFSGDKVGPTKSTLVFLDIGHNNILRVTRMDFPRLASLSLDKNKISSLQSDVFDQLVNLKHLNLSGNKIETLPAGLFHRVYDLLNLDISHNLLQNISLHAFSNLNLAVLNLKHNKLKGIGEGAFKSLEFLRTLDLSNNEIINIQAFSFEKLPALKTLDLSGNELSSFGAEIFRDVPNLEEINLSNNAILYLYPDSFSVHTKLRTLNLGSNRLPFLPNAILSSIKSLQHVILSKNNLKSLQGDDFANMPNLRIVELQENEINKIDEKLFQNSSQLHWIYLQDNFLSSIPQPTFRGISRLNLDLSGNNLNSLPAEIFNRHSVFKLERINLAHNDFHEFPASALKRQYSYLEKANLSYNKISNLPSNSDVLVNLKELDLSYNPLSKDAYQVLFAEPKSVRRLYLRGVGISSLPTLESPFLEILDLSNNDLVLVEGSVFQKTNKLTSLDLSKNKIPNIRVNLNGAWPKLPRLSSLLLSDNPILYISRSDFSNLGNLETLHINNLTDLTQFDCEAFDGLHKLRELWMFGYPSIQNVDIGLCLAGIIGLENLKIEIKDLQLQNQLNHVYSPRLKEIAITGSQLKSLSSSSLAGINAPNVKISLSDSGITALSANVFRPLPLNSKIVFDLTNGQLRTLSPDVLLATENKQMDITILGLETNPMSCDCHLIPLWKFLHQRSSQKIICFSPPEIRSRRLQSLREEELTCRERTSTTTTTYRPPISLKRTTPSLEVLYDLTTTHRPMMPPLPPGAANRTTLTKVDTMIIGIIAGVVAFVCILVIVICIVRLRRVRPHYTAGPLAGPLALRAQGNCTCLKPPPSTCTCYSPFPPLSITYPRMHQQALTAPNKMLPLPAPPPVGSGRHRQRKAPSYYVTYPESDNDIR